MSLLPNHPDLYKKNSLFFVFFVCQPHICLRYFILLIQRCLNTLLSLIYLNSINIRKIYLNTKIVGRHFYFVKLNSYIEVCSKSLGILVQNFNLSVV